MYVILGYDVHSKRVAKVLKIVRKYLTPVQLSMFEGELRQRDLRLLMQELDRVMVEEEDKLFIFTTQTLKYTKTYRKGYEERGYDHFI